MAKPKKLAARVAPVTGWVLIALNEEDTPDWHIGWLDIFSTKKRALDFAKTNNWSSHCRYRAVRGCVAVL